MATRFLIWSLPGLLVGALLAAGVQIGHNLLRYLAQPSWLDAAIAPMLLGLSGLAGGGLMAAALVFSLRRLPQAAKPGIGSFLLLLFAFLADPYFLAELGWRGPALHEQASRAAAMTLAGLAIAALLVSIGTGRVLALAAGALAVISYTLLPRFALVPVLGGDLDLAAMTPVHILVFGKGMLLLLLAGAAALALSEGRRARTRG